MTLLHDNLDSILTLKILVSLVNPILTCLDTTTSGTVSPSCLPLWSPGTGECTQNQTNHICKRFYFRYFLLIACVTHKRHRHQIKAAGCRPAQLTRQWEESIQWADQWETRRQWALVTQFIVITVHCPSARCSGECWQDASLSLTGPITKPEATRFFSHFYTKVHFVHSH